MSTLRTSLSSLTMAVLVATLSACSGGGGASDAAAPPAPVPTPPPQTLAGISLLAGSPGGSGNIDGIGAAARLGTQFSVAAADDGTLYLADNGTVRKVTPAGAVTTIAGNGKVGALDGAGAAAGFAIAGALAVDGTGNVYVADLCTIRKLTPAAVVSTLAGQANRCGASDGAGADAGFRSPQGVAVDDAGNIYVADTGNATIRKITPAGVVITVAGKAGETAVTDGAAPSARFNGPNGIAVDGSGTIYVSDFDGGFYYVRKISANGAVSTVAKISSGFTTQFKYDGQVGLSADRAGNLYLTTDTDIRKFSADGSVATLAGTAGVKGYVDATGSGARFQNLWSIAADRKGNVYVSDSNALRKITSAGLVTTLAGAREESGTDNGTGAAARFANLSGIASDAAGNVFVTQGAYGGNETPVQAIRMISPAGVVTTLAGSADKAGAADGNGAEALFNNPTGLAVDSARNVYVADKGNRTIRKIAANGAVTTFAGAAGQSGTDDGAGAAARFWLPTHLAIDSANNLYVADLRTIRKITPAGVVTTLALSYAANDVQLSNIAGIAVDRGGNLYVSDTDAIFGFSSSIVRKITPAGNVTTLAGKFRATGNVDGSGAAASFSFASGIAVGADGNVYVADSSNNLVRRITPDGVVTTVAGQRGSQGVSLGTLPGSLYQPRNLSAGPNGEIYVTSPFAVLKLRF